VWISSLTDFSDFELDEIFWFTKRRNDTETGVNAYVMTMISRIPRQVAGFAVDNRKSQSTIQRIVDSVPSAKTYHTDGYYGYADIDFIGRHNQNFLNKNDTHNIESINADFRHYIPGLRRRSRCFYRTLETFRAVLALFVNAYNKFGEAKLKYRMRKANDNNKRIDYPFSFLDFL
jgi:IS1 family transposase